MMDPRVLDPARRHVDLAGMEPERIAGAVAVLEALRDWHSAERRSREASRRYMELGETDMAAVRFLLAMGNHRRVATPVAIAEHLGITMPSTTKLLRRLEAGGHIVRRPHPNDGRSTVVEVSEGTRQAAWSTVGRDHSRRFVVAADLDSTERAAVLRFLRNLTAVTEDGLPARDDDVYPGADPGRG